MFPSRFDVGPRIARKISVILAYGRRLTGKVKNWFIPRWKFMCHT
jgi:hypothetical protein